MIVYDNQLHVFHSTLIDDEHFLSGFSTRSVGDGCSRSTLINFCEQNRLSYNSIVIPGQVHSTDIAVIQGDGDVIQTIHAVDGVMSSTPEVFLTVITADCVPMVIADKKNGVVGVSHQGWQGSLKNMASRMIESMEKKGAEVDSIVAAIGPAIGSCCYEIYGDRLEKFMNKFGDFEKEILFRRFNKTYLSLSALNYQQLLQRGVKKEHIDFFPFCTKCDKERFFSYQRDNADDYGEMFSYIMKV